MRRILSILAAGGIAFAATGLTPPSPAAAQSAACKINGPAEQYNLTLDDFGRGGEPYTLRDEHDYWGGTGHLISYQRGDYDSWLSTPTGAYIFSGVVVAADATSASNDMRSAVSGWTSEWKTAEDVRSPSPIGDEISIVTRLTPWEVAPEQPMTEVFLAFRRCNVSAQVNLVVMPKLDPVNAALHYARILDQRFRS
jgi:hypothetical protein